MASKQKTNKYKMTTHVIKPYTPDPHNTKASELESCEMGTGSWQPDEYLVYDDECGEFHTAEQVAEMKKTRASEASSTIKPMTGAYANFIAQANNKSMRQNFDRTMPITPKSILVRDEWKLLEKDSGCKVEYNYDTGEYNYQEALDAIACIRKLEALHLPSVSKVPMMGKKIPARIVKILDGDTICVAIMIGDEALKINVRVASIDAPETKLGGVNKTSADEKAAGLKVKEYVSKLYKDCNDIVFIKIVCADKYFRYVADVYLPGSEETLSAHLLDLKYAKPYSGGTKCKWTKEEFCCICTL